MVIDVDAHFEPARDWLDEFPALKTELPELLPDTDPRFRMDTGEMFAYFVSDDLLRNVPREQRMPIEQLVTPVMQLMFDPERPEELATRIRSVRANDRPRAAWRGWTRSASRSST